MARMTETERAFKQSAKIIVDGQKSKYGKGWEYLHEDIRRAVCVEQIVPTVVSWGHMSSAQTQTAATFSEAIATLWRAVLAEVSPES
jgi:hypothetical protein